MRRSKLVGCKPNKQSNNKLMKIILSPIRILRKARDFYLKSLEDCAAMAGHFGGGVVCPAPPAPSYLPKSFGVNSSMDEEFRSLLRATSKRESGDESKVQVQQQQSRMIKKEPTMAVRSYSVGIGKIGRIDEDKPCSFEEDDSMADLLLYSRSRSHAVRTPIVYL